MATRKTIWSVLGYITIACTLASVARADDFNPPPWRGVGPFFTIQAWDFNTPANPTAPDGDPFLNVWGNSGGVPSASFSDMHWIQSGPDGGWVPNTPNGGQIDIICPNWIDNEPLKWLRIQITAIGNPATPPTVIGVTGSQGGPGFPGFPLTPPIAFDPIHFWQDWAIQPNPWEERININVPADMFVTQIVIDTISFPEPASMGTILGGTMLMLARRRRAAR